MSGSKITSPLTLSEGFQEFMKKEKATRSDVYSAICAHIRENSLRQESGAIQYDATLKALLGEPGADKYPTIMKQIAKAGAFEA